MQAATHIDLSFRDPKIEPELKRAIACEAFSAEHVSIVSAEPYDYAYHGGGHYLALHDIVRSDGETFVDGSSCEHVKDIRNKMTFIPADCTASGWTSPLRRRNSFLAIYFSPEAVTRQIGDNGPAPQFGPRIYFEDASLLSTLLKIETLLRQQNPPDKLYAETLGMLAAIEIYRLQSHERKLPDVVPGGLTRRQMQLLVEFMDARLHIDISLTDLAMAVGLSQFHFARLFKATTGTTPHQYVLSLRIARARELLRRPGVPVREIASASGFKGATQFSRAFLRMVGMTPSEYRRSF